MGGLQEIIGRKKESDRPLKKPEAPSRNLPSLLIFAGSKIVKAEIE
jgi:hypothetical protein